MFNLKFYPQVTILRSHPHIVDMFDGINRNDTQEHDIYYFDLTCEYDPTDR